jgi:hypothetical protein
VSAWLGEVGDLLDVDRAVHDNERGHDLDGAPLPASLDVVSVASCETIPSSTPRHRRRH